MKNDNVFTTSKLEILEDKEDEPGRYGWGRYTPRSLQKLRSPIWATAFFCTASLTQGIIINGLLHFFLPMIERRFLLTSTQSGFMSGAYDIAALLCLMPITYLGGRRGAHKPRYIGYGVLIMGTGSLIFSVPAFFVGPYRQNALKELCTPGVKNMIVETDENYTLFFWVLFFGNFLHGIGASPLYTLVVTFIDESVSVDHSSLYLGFYYMMAVVGPFVGIASGGGLAQIDGDLILYSAKSIKNDLTPDSPAWIGCWWLGFIICGIASYLFAVPILGLPRELPETRVHRAEREKLHAQTALITFTKIQEFPKAVLHIIRNAKFLFITFAGCSEAIIFSGMGAFLTKLLHQQFGLTPSEVAFYMCIITVPSTLAGILFGGWIIKFYQMNLKQILIMAVCFMLLTVPCVGALFVSCPNLSIAGITVPYPLEGNSKDSSSLSLISGCNEDCGCDESNFSPVCGKDKVEYYSACYAGCLKKKFIKKNKVFLNCSCVSVKGEDDIHAFNYPCKEDCPLFPVFVILLFFYQIFSFSTLIPAVTSTLRVVEVDSRSLAMGVQWLLGRALGTIPGPVIFGHVIDKACVHWLPKAGFQGNCLLYNHSILSRNLALVIFSFKLLEIIFFSIALCLASKNS